MSACYQQIMFYEDSLSSGHILLLVRILTFITTKNRNMNPPYYLQLNNRDFLQLCNRIEVHKGPFYLPEFN